MKTFILIICVGLALVGLYFLVDPDASDPIRIAVLDLPKFSMIADVVDGFVLKLSGILILPLVVYSIKELYTWSKKNSSS